MNGSLSKLAPRLQCEPGTVVPVVTTPVPGRLSYRESVRDEGTPRTRSENEGDDTSVGFHEFDSTSTDDLRDGWWLGGHRRRGGRVVAWKP